jgi:hypothetical protein
VAVEDFPMGDEFDNINSPEEIARILKVAVTLNIEVYCELAGSVQPAVIELDIRGVSGSQVVFGLKRDPGSPGLMLASAFPNGLNVGSRVEVIFGLVDGQYAIRDVVEAVSMTTFTVDASRNLLRLQRRKDFRDSVKNEGLRFVKKTPKLNEPALEFKLLDLSAGGLRLVWSTGLGPVPALGTLLEGTLHLSTQKTADVQIKLVKNHGPEAELSSGVSSGRGYALSFQFQNLSQEDSRAILFACLFIHRGNYASR